MDINLAQLTESQRVATEHVEGPLLILAGPGSGKTRVVTHRIANLLRSGVAARSILALTFTNKAADEMRHRVADLAPGEPVWVSTFHRFCARMLRDHAQLVGLAENYTILDSADSQRALAHALDGLQDLNLGQISVDKLRYAISHCKNNLITAEQYRPTSRSPVAVLLSDVYPAYQRQLLIANAVDFDDLLLHTVDLLRNHEPIRAELDERYRYVMVDEYQDSNLAQYAIARALSIDYPNLAVTGDPDQSIYAWRGANISNILDFERDYGRVHVVRLEHNFRSSPQILSVADELIRYNRKRKKKSLIPVRESGEPVRLLAFPSQHDESRHIAEEILSLVRRGIRRYRDFAIFYRINALSRYLEHALHEHNVPYQVLNGVEFYQRKEVKDVLGYLHLINNPSNDVAFLRIVNTPARGLGKVTIAKLQDHARRDQLAMLQAARRHGPALGKRAARAMQQFVAMFDRLTEMATAPVEEIVGHVLSESGYEAHVRENDERGGEDRSANIHELLSAARQFDMLHEGDGYLDGFLEQASLVADTDAWEDEADKVTLMTLHGSKGLEFPVVYMVAVEQGKLPHERSREDPDQLEEERRLMFVGLTRAQDALTISYANYRDYRGQLAPAIPSRFLMELPRQEMQVITPEAFDAPEYPPDWDDLDGELDDPALDFDPKSFADEDAPSTTSPEKPPVSDASSGLRTAASLANNETDLEDTPPRPDPNVFVRGMRVQHAKYGLGKIVALSGSGQSRTATVNFVLAGEKRFILSKSALRPLSS